MVMDKTLFELTCDYFKVYLPNIKKRSIHTIRSYRRSLDDFLEFARVSNRLKLREVTFSMLDAKMLGKYLDTLEIQGNSVKTRNDRLNAIKSFYAYASDMNIEAIPNAIEILKFPAANTPKYQKVDYLSESALNALLSQPNASTSKGLRDRFFLLLMYDTGMRLQEIRDLKLKDINWGKDVQATVHGKGDRYRLVPITSAVVAELKHYLKVFHPSTNRYDDEYLFYTLRNGSKFQLSDSIARKFVREYGESAQKECSEVPNIVHPHMLRHNRAMHLYQRGVDLELIQQWLGHSKLETTYTYAYADTELKRQALESAIDPSSPLANHRDPERFTLNEDDEIRKLYGLK
jgi:site-specific recombinase XerD